VIDLMKVCVGMEWRCWMFLTLHLSMQMTSITTDDIVATLQHLGLIRYWNGSHVISVAPELVDARWKRLVGDVFVLHVCSFLMPSIRQNGKRGPTVDATKLHWAPLRIMVKKRDRWLISAKVKALTDDS